MTIKIYDSEPYSRSFTARILRVQPVSGESAALIVTLDRTLFFPEEGGQSCDTGTLGGFPVTDVQIKDDVILHRLEGAEALLSLKEGMLVHGEIDWEERFSKMQNHTGEHILSGLMHEKYGFENVGFHLGGNTVTLDVNGQLDEEQITALEREANEVVYRNVPVRAEYPSPEALEEMSYRSKKEIEGPVRIVTVEGVDRCACCAPHVASTGEIGLIKIVRVMHFRGGMRLFILCGRRALLEMQHRQRNIEAVSRMTNRPQEEIDDAVRVLLQECGTLKQRIRELEIRLAAEQQKAVPADAVNVFLFAEEMDNIVQRNFVNALCAEHPGFCGVFCGEEKTGYRFILGAGHGGGDCRELCVRLRRDFGARGGGKPEMVQGTVFGDSAQIRSALEDEACAAAQRKG